MTWTSPVIPWDKCDAPRKAALREAWRRGELSYKLDPNQLQVYQAFRAWESNPKRRDKVFVFDISRRYGKSLIQLLICVENCIRRERSRVPYASSTLVAVKEILLPLMEDMLIDCPPDLRPTYTKADASFRFKNRSRLLLVGCDVNPHRLRGTHLDFGAVDEAAFFGNLEEILVSVLFPQMQGRKGASLLCGSTPPTSPSHYWSETVVPQAMSNNAHVHRTIEDNPRLSKAEIEDEINLLGGREATACRRELFAEHVAEETLMIVPEYRREREHVWAQDPPLPQWCFTFVSMDPGWSDMTGVLFGYIDWNKQCLVLEDELCLPQANTNALAKSIRDKEEKLWKSRPYFSRSRGGVTKPNPIARITDVDHRLIQDLYQDHDLRFIPTAKDNLDQQIVSLRDAFQKHRILVNSTCPITDKHLSNGVWANDKRKNFSRSGDFGHFDMVAALVYLWRNVQPYLRRNPNPDMLWGKPTENMFVRGQKRGLSGGQESASDNGFRQRARSRRRGKTWTR